MIIKKDFYIYSKEEPVLSIDEIETLLVMIVNQMPQMLYLMPTIIDAVNDFAERKKGNKNENMVIKGREFLDNVLQENLKPSTLQLFRPFDGLSSEESEETGFM